MKPDKIAILVILSLAVAAASFAWWFRRSQGYRASEFWGQQGYVIRHATAIELRQIRPLLAPNTDSQALMDVDGHLYEITKRRDITKAPGMLNARQAMIEDASFEWEKELDSNDQVWEYAIVFALGSDQSVVLLDLTQARLRSQSIDKMIGMHPIKRGLDAIISEQLAE